MSQLGASGADTWVFAQPCLPMGTNRDHLVDLCELQPGDGALNLYQQSLFGSPSTWARLAPGYVEIPGPQEALGIRQVRSEFFQAGTG